MLQIFKDKLNNDGELYLTVKVRPGASKNDFKEIMPDGTFKISIAASPERGRANRELIIFLAELMDASKADVLIISGVTDMKKLIKIVKNKIK